jgi:RHS repeat-associated protein
MRVAMGKVTALMMDTITDKSGHQMTGMAVSVCLTPAAPSPLPIPYPTMGTVSEGLIDECLRTKIENAKILTVGGCMKACHGNEAGTLKEVVSLNTGGPCFPWLGAPTVFIELGMAGITGSMGQMNKAITVGAGGSASGAGGGGSGGGGGGGGGGGPGSAGPQGPSNGGGGGGGSGDGAGPPNPPAPPTAEGQAAAAHPIDVMTGAMYTSPKQDFLLPGPFSVGFVRRYTSSGVGSRCGLGWGWSHNLHWYARREAGRIVLVDPDFRETPLPDPADGEVLVLPYGLKVGRFGEDLAVDLDDGAVRVLRWDEAAKRYVLAELRDDAGNAVALSWERGELAGLVDAAGRRVTVVRDGTLVVYRLAVDDDAGQTHTKTLVVFELDERGDLVRAIDGGGVETTYAYDDRHALVRESLPNGMDFCFVYADVFGQRRCVESWGEQRGGDVLRAIGWQAPGDRPVPRGVFHTRLSWGPEPYEARVVDGLGFEHRYHGNALGLVTAYQDPRGYVTQYAYDGAGRLVSVRDPEGRALRRRFDLSGRPLSATLGDKPLRSMRFADDTGEATITEPDGATRGVRFERSRLVEQTDELGRKTTLAYDDRGLLATVTHPDGVADTYTYDAHGNVIEASYRGGERRVRYAFDLFGRPVRVETPKGVPLELEYDSRDYVVAIREPGGKLTAFEHGPTGHLVAEREPNGHEVRYRMVADVTVESVHSDGRRYRAGYDPLLRLVWIENPAGERHLYEHDPCGNIWAETSFSGLRTEYEHDGAGEIVRVTHPDGSWMRLVHDDHGRVRVREHSTGARDEYVYDARGGLLSAKSGASEVSFERDALGRLVREEQRLGGFRFEASYAYDTIGRTVERRYSSGWSVSAERRAGDGAPASWTVEDEGRPAARILLEYDQRGVETARALGDGGPRVTTESDRYGLPAKRALVSASGAELASRAYVWSKAGPLEAVHDARAGSRRYTLDEVGRPLAVSGLGASERFAYSPQGTPVPEGQGWSLGRGGRPLRTQSALLEWDAMGRLARRQTGDRATSYEYRYDERSRLAQVTRGDGLVVRYHYDALGRRLAMTAGDRSVYFGWSGDSAVEEVLSTGGRVRRVFEDDGYTPLAESRAGAPFRAVVTDAASTPWLFVGDDGSFDEVDLASWGKVARASGDPGTLRLAGQRWEAEAGLAYNRHRHYDPELGLFLTPDPMGIWGSFHELGFVPNVTLYVDPSGLTTIVVGQRGDKAIESHKASLEKMYPGAKVVYHDELKHDTLANENHVIVSTHGYPGGVEWGEKKKFLGIIPYGRRPTANGQQLGKTLTDAGFKGGPGTRVDLSTCNGATPPNPKWGIGSDSTAQGVADHTKSDTFGAASSDPQATYRGDVDDISGKKWYQFWKKPNNWGPGMMAPIYDPAAPNDPSRTGMYVHKGTYTQVPAKSP